MEARSVTKMSGDDELKGLGVAFFGESGEITIE
jgi:hypothetical protein